MAGSLGTIVNVAVTTKQQASATSLPNLYGMTVHAAPGNTVNLLVYLGSSASAYLTLAPDDAFTFDPAQLPNITSLYLAAADGATSTAAEIVA